MRNDQTILWQRQTWSGARSQPIRYLGDHRNAANEELAGDGVPPEARQS